MMTLEELRQHLIDHHGYNWHTANHPSHTEEFLRSDHQRCHEDDTAVYLDHDHLGE